MHEGFLQLQRRHAGRVHGRGAHLRRRRGRGADSDLGGSASIHGHLVGRRPRGRLRGRALPDRGERRHRHLARATTAWWRPACTSPPARSSRCPTGRWPRPRRSRAGRGTMFIRNSETGVGRGAGPQGPLGLFNRRPPRQLSTEASAAATPGRAGARGPAAGRWAAPGRGWRPGRRWRGECPDGGLRPTPGAGQDHREQDGEGDADDEEQHGPLGPAAELRHGLSETTRAVRWRSTPRHRRRPQHVVALLLEPHRQQGNVLLALLLEVVEALVGPELEGGAAVGRDRCSSSRSSASCSCWASERHDDGPRVGER